MRESTTAVAANADSSDRISIQSSKEQMMMGRTIFFSKNSKSWLCWVGLVALGFMMLTVNRSSIVWGEESTTKPATKPAAEACEDAKECESQAGCDKPSTDTSLIPVTFNAESPQSKMADGETIIFSTPSLGFEATENQQSTQPQKPGKSKRFIATHAQSNVISINAEGLSEQSLHSFCLLNNGELAAGCGDGPGEIRIFDPTGEYLRSLPLSIKPEAINQGADGNIYIAGQGQLLKITGEGEIVLQSESPHAAEVGDSEEKIREEVVSQFKQMAESYTEMIAQFQEQIDRIEAKEEEQRSASEEQTLESMLESKEQFEKMLETRGMSAELTDEQLGERVEAAISRKLRFASICQRGDDVFVATPAATGHGFEIWRMDSQFANAEKIVSGLSGCCGQMDVQAGDDGVFVAENSRHRVSQYDRQGDLVKHWGTKARTGVKGFGSCCNPMNVAVGEDGSVYSAESGTGRIKRYDLQGELLELIGSVDLVPGCKKVAIGVATSGDQVYMLDITRNHIVMMERRDPTAIAADYEAAEANDSGNQEASSGSSFRSSFRSTFARLLKRAAAKSE